MDPAFSVSEEKQSGSAALLSSEEAFSLVLALAAEQVHVVGDMEQELERGKLRLVTSQAQKA